MCSNVNVIPPPHNKPACAFPRHVALKCNETFANAKHFPLISSQAFQWLHSFPVRWDDLEHYMQCQIRFIQSRVTIRKAPAIRSLCIKYQAAVLKNMKQVKCAQIWKCSNKWRWKASIDCDLIKRLFYPSIYFLLLSFFFYYTANSTMYIRLNHFILMETRAA